MELVQFCLYIYFIDVLGGAATLIITPANESILVDSGWYTENGRDAKRILEVLSNHPEISQIDYCITTHWHLDHYGALGHLAREIYIRNFYDRGIPESFPEDEKNFPFLIERYKKVTAGKSKILRPGDVIELKQSSGKPKLELLCVAADREVIESSGSGPTNPFCKSHEPRPKDLSDNANSIALRLSYGDFQFFLGGDITWNIEHDLVCPDNRVGEIDLYMVNHHGFDISNNPVFLRSLNPTVAIFCNGPRKGCDPRVMADLRKLPQIKAIYQLHRNIETRDENNTQPDYIANPDPEKSGRYIKASVSTDGKLFQITIGEKQNPRIFESR